MYWKMMVGYHTLDLGYFYGCLSSFIFWHPIALENWTGEITRPVAQGQCWVRHLNNYHLWYNIYKRQRTKRMSPLSPNGPSYSESLCGYIYIYRQQTTTRTMVWRKKPTPTLALARNRTLVLWNTCPMLYPISYKRASERRLLTPNHIESAQQINT